jgi:sporulation protein YlmC with PRC-barrel domain
MTQTVTVATEEATQFTIGAEANCSDGVCGEVSRVVLDPVARALTHLVVKPMHRRGLGKLVPLELVDAATGEVRLACTLAEFDELDAAEETQFLPASGYPGYDADRVVAWPYFGMAGGLRGRMGLGVGYISYPVTIDVVPVGEVAVRRGEHVHASDGDIGRVQGLVIDGHQRVSHVLLQEGHLWGRNDVAIPIGVVTGVDVDGITLGISKQEVQDLPPVEIEPPD